MALVQRVQEAYPGQQGVIVLFAGFEHSRYTFVQDSSFYYYTGIEEPGVIVTIELNGKTTLYVPHFSINRSSWVVTQDVQTVDAVEYLGHPMDGYSPSLYFKPEQYETIVNQLSSSTTIFTPLHQKQYAMHCYLVEKFISFFKTKPASIDISSHIARMRQVKDADEIMLIKKAITITNEAHQGVAEAIQQRPSEAELHGIILDVYAKNGAQEAFPSIVASGKNATILHYTSNNALLKEQQAVVVDIGAMYQHYCADITRTYTTSSWTKEQEKIYTIVADTHRYIASLARPGYWLNNRNVPEKSLHHCAHAYLREQGYDRYFIHGLGHYLGLDVHDVGDYSQPLQPNEIFTIEPGLYLPEQEIGVRLEDDYLVTVDGVECLSR